MGTKVKKLVIGLGNPGVAYSLTRHNVGFMVADLIAHNQNLKFQRDKLHKAEGALWSEKNTVLLKPTTFMNLSGQSVLRAVDSFNIEGPSDLLIVHDDVDLELGRIRLKTKGGTGLHKGLVSIVKCLKSKDFARLRIGVGPVNTNQHRADYVLSSFAKKDDSLLDTILELAANVVGKWIDSGISGARNCLSRYYTKLAREYQKTGTK